MKKILDSLKYQLDLSALVVDLEDHRKITEVVTSGAYKKTDCTEEDCQRLLAHLTRMILKNPVFKQVRIHRNESFESVLNAIVNTELQRQQAERASKTRLADYL